MKEWLLNYLRCPKTGAPLRLEQAIWQGDDIESGMLVTPAGGQAYPIIRGIPRLVEGIRSEADLQQTYVESFGNQWNGFDSWRDVDEREFFSVSDRTPETLAGKVVLDAGCGVGRFSRVMGQHCRRLVGFDLSVGVDRARRHTRHLGNCEFVQADAHAPPFAPQRFDYVWSHGVLHHSRDTKVAFEKLAPLVTEGGTFQLIVFFKAWLPLRITDSLARALVRNLPERLALRVCRAMGGLRHLPFPSWWKRFFWFSLYPTAELRTFCNHDWYMPRYHHEHTVPEVKGWFEEQGFVGLRYINGWPYAPLSEKYTEPDFGRGARLGQLLGVVGQRPGVVRQAGAARSPGETACRTYAAAMDGC